MDNNDLIQHRIFTKKKDTRFARTISLRFTKHRFAVWRVGFSGSGFAVSGAGRRFLKGKAA